METIERAIRQFIADDILYSGDGYPYPDDVSFLEEGIIDSMGVIELAAFVSDYFEITVEDNELVPSNFDSISNIANYVYLKLSVRVIS
ncbi:MAG: acyl carrier protein [Anaerolineae bacterium]|nr:acyl carrier protein [Anaerolineae bacterium]